MRAALAAPFPARGVCLIRNSPDVFLALGPTLCTPDEKVQTCPRPVRRPKAPLAGCSAARAP